MLTLIVLAGGMGSRFGGEKQKFEFGPQGQTLPEYALLHARQAGFEQFIVVIKEGQRDEWTGFLEPRIKAIGLSWKNVELAEQPWPALQFMRNKPWGTTHALLCGARQAKGDFMMVNGDDYYGSNAYLTMAAHLKNKPAMTGYLLPYRLDQTLSKFGPVSRAICETDAQNNLTAITEMHGLKEPLSIKGDTPVSMNCWAFGIEIIPTLELLFHDFLNRGPQKNEEFVIPQAVQLLIDVYGYRVRVLLMESGWFGVTYRDDIEMVKQRLRES